MRKLISFNMITADGYFEGQQEDISWHRVDEEVNEFIIEQMETTDTIKKQFPIILNLKIKLK